MIKGVAPLPISGRYKSDLIGRVFRTDEARVEAFDTGHESRFNNDRIRHRRQNLLVEMRIVILEYERLRLGAYISNEDFIKCVGCIEGVLGHNEMGKRYRYTESSHDGDIPPCP